MRGNGYIEELVEARMMREAHLGQVWEGTSNIVAQDAIRRAVGREGAAGPFAAPVPAHAGIDRRPGGLMMLPPGLLAGLAGLGIGALLLA